MSKMIMIFGHARSGTSNLRNIVRCGKGMTILGEPFNPQFKTWNKYNFDYCKLANKGGLDEAMKMMSIAHRGFKHLTYQLTREMNLKLLNEYSDKIIFIYRKNLLQTAVSTELAIQTSIWAADDTNDIDKAYARLKPLNIDAIQSTINKLSSDIEFYNDSIGKLNHIKTTYEDMFINHNHNHNIARIVKFLDIKEFDYHKAKGFIADSNKINTTDRYKLIPNYKDIVKLGSNKIGFLV